MVDDETRKHEGVEREERKKKEIENRFDKRVKAGGD